MTRTLPVQRPGTTRTLLREGDGGLVRRTVLPGGLRVLTEAVPTVRSASIGVWVGVGSRDETPRLAGATHYLEHLLFKGTRRRSALDISSAIETVGGEINAFTDKELTCYHARVLDEDLPLAVDVLADMLTSSLVRSADVEGERDVVLEEIAVRDDEPDDLVHELLLAQMWGEQTPLGRSILGTAESVKALSRTVINGWYRRRYRPENIVVTVAGNVEHASVVRLVKRAFGAGGFLDGDAEPTPARTGGRPPAIGRGIGLLSRPTEQAHVVLGLPGIRRTDERRYALGVLNATLGGGMSSRLFQEVREKRGLAYTVYSYATQYSDAGLLGVFVGCIPSKVDQVLEVVRREVTKVADGGITEEELVRGKGQLRGGIVLGLEDTGSRMSRLAKAELTYGELPSISELVATIDAVTLDDVSAVAAELFAGTPSLAVVGPFDDTDRFAGAIA